MKLRTTVVFVAAACSFGAASAQANLDGKWEGTMANRVGRLLPLEVSLSAGAGTWRVNTPGRSENACANRDLPVTVTKSGADGVVLTVNGSKALAGCNDVAVNLKQVDDRTLEGAAEGRAIKLTRK